MKKLLPALCTGLFTLLLSTTATSQPVDFTPVNMPENNTSTVALSITQDIHGFLWLATQTGLYKYDGYHYTAFHPQPSKTNSLLANNIECIAAASDGSIWMGFYNNALGVQRYDPATRTFTHYQHRDNDPTTLANNFVSVILQDHEGKMWVGTNGGLDCFDPVTGHFIHHWHNEKDSFSLSYDHVRSIYEDRTGTIWVGTGNVWEDPQGKGGLNRLDRRTGGFTRYLHQDNDTHSLVDNRVRAIFEDSQGNLWVGSAGDGLHKLDRKTGSFQRFPFDPLNPDNLSRPPVRNSLHYGMDQIDHITFILEDNNHRLWIGTLEGGINVYDPASGKMQHYGKSQNAEEGPRDDDFFTAFKSRDGVIWISAWASHLYKIKPREIKIPYTHVGENVYGFAEDAAHTLWLATSNGLITRDIVGKQQRLPLNSDSSKLYNRILCIEPDRNNNLWLGTLHGLYHLDKQTGKFTHYDLALGQPSGRTGDTNTIKYILSDNLKSQLWVGTNDGLHCIHQDGQPGVRYAHLPGDSSSLSNNIIEKIIRDQNGQVWIATDLGLNMQESSPSQFKKYLDQLYVACITLDDQGGLWAATNQGIYHFDSTLGDFVNFTDASAIISPSMDASWLTEDNEMDLWLNTQKGIIRMNPQTGQTTLFGANQGVAMKPLENGGFRRANGEVVYGDTAGYYTFQNGNLEVPSIKPILDIASFSLGNAGSADEGTVAKMNQALAGKSIVLKHNQNSFSFQFNDIDFISAHEDAQLLFTLEGYENSWHIGNDDRAAYYYDVPPGSYLFRLKASNSYGSATEQDIKVIISPPWWKTWWAYLLFAAFALACIWSFISWRSRLLRDENKMLEEKVAHRTAQLKDSLENLQSAQAQLIQSEKMASLGVMTAGIAHEIQNPLNFVTNFSEINSDLVEEVKQAASNGNTAEVMTICDNISENEKKINLHGKRAEAIVKSMLQHSRASTLQKELTDVNALADSYCRLAYRAFTTKDKTFACTIQMQLDPSMGKINIAPQEVGRVLLNIFNNAFYAVSERHIKQGASYQPLVTVSTSRGAGKVSVTVSDNGPGISSHLLDKIFQPFFTTKPPGAGVGLGLSMSYEIMKASAGDIRLETTEGAGARFTLEWPDRPRSAEEPEKELVPLTVKTIK